MYGDHSRESPKHECVEMLKATFILINSNPIYALFVCERSKIKDHFNKKKTGSSAT